MSRFAGHTALAAAGLVAAGMAWAQAPEENALMLADKAPKMPAKGSDWRTFVEAAVGGTVQRSDGASKDNRRLSLDIQYDHSISPDWRVFVSDRLDTSWPAQSDNQNSINTLKEAYLSWRVQPEAMLDMGRINVRNGEAMGYNPTDFFRSGAVRSAVSISPASLKENRQGSIVLRAQRLWESGSVTASFSPRLDRRPDPEGFSLDVGATNRQNRGLIAVSQKIGSLTPQFLIYRETALPTQFGLNLTGLINDATVAYVEWSAGRSTSLLAQALRPLLPVCTCSSWRNHLSTGLTYTTPTKVSLTAEYHYNGGGLDESAWSALRQGPLIVYDQYRSWVQAVQELPTKRALFFYGVWQDALVNRLDLSLMHNFDLADSSRRIWLEARYHVGQFEYAAQWQRNSGQHLSTYGAMPESRSWQAAMRYYF